MIEDARVSARIWAPASPAWSDDPRWYTERLTLDGEEWFARIRPGTDPALPPVVMIHGLIVSGSYFQPVANLMHDGYPAYIPDLPGVGRAKSSQYWSLPSFTTRLAAWIDAQGLEGAIIVGNSLGCQIATLLAESRPDLVRGLVLIGPTLDPAITNVPQLLWRGIRDIPLERPSIWKIWIPDFFRTGFRRSMRMLREMFRDDQLPRLERLHQPSLLIGGERDPIIPPAWVREMTSRIPGGEAIIIGGAPHALNYSSPQDLVDAIERAVGQGDVFTP